MAHGVEDVVFEVEDTTTSPNSWDTVGKVNQVPNLNPQKSTRDRTAIGDTTRKIFTGGLEDPGQITVPVTFDAEKNPKHKQLLDDYDNGTERNYRIRIADGSPEDTFEFAATVQAYNGPSGGIDEDVTMEFTLQLTGGVTVNLPTG